MSLNMFKPKIVKITDPLIEAEPRKYFACLKGGVETTEREFVSNTFSQSSTQFSVPPPNPTTFVSRRFMLKQPVTIVLTGDTGDSGVHLYQTGTSGFRSYPLASVMQTLDLVLNGASVSLQMNDVIKPLLLYHNNERDLGMREMSMTPAAMDQSQQYSDLYMSNRNPLGGFQDGGLRTQLGRGAFPYSSIANSSTETTIQAVLTEEMFLSPLLFGGVRDEGFIGLQKIEMNITWDSQLSRIWSVDADNSSITSVAVTFGQPSVLFRYVTPPMDLSIPRSVQYSYNAIQRYPTSAGTINAGASTVAISNNIQLNAIPRYIYLFVRKQSQTYNDTDSYCAINGVRVNWNNQNALLSNASQQQLYDICRKNGVDLPWHQWSGLDMYHSSADSNAAFSGVGSVLCLEFGTDIGLREDECAGLIGTYNLQVELDVTNKSSASFDARFYIITIIPGCFTIYDNAANKRIGVINRDEVLMAKSASGMGYYDLQKNLKSGGFKIRPRKWLRKAEKKLAAYDSKIRPLIPAQYRSGYDLARNVARGLAGTKKRTGRKKRRKAKKKGSAAVGGKLMSKGQLRNFLNGY